VLLRRAHVSGTLALVIGTAAGEVSGAGDVTDDGRGRPSRSPRRGIRGSGKGRSSLIRSMPPAMACDGYDLWESAGETAGFAIVQYQPGLGPERADDPLD
jgi:hypothetical protein